MLVLLLLTQVLKKSFYRSAKKKTLWALVGVLGFSRFMMIKFVWTNSVEVTMNTIEEMYRELGGVPRKIVSDNPKCFATEASLYEPVINVVMERFASHYNIIFELLPPRRPELKGKVERLVPYTRRLFESYGEFVNLNHAQDHMNKKLIIANERKHGTLKKTPDRHVSIRRGTLIKRTSFTGIYERRVSRIKS